MKSSRLSKRASLSRLSCRVHLEHLVLLAKHLENKGLTKEAQVINNFVKLEAST